ncbi:MAG: hypothetical protein HS109_09895 [Burkholderiales bacterium]|nr:hypothetical protein [Burkholderiales bacterium]
MRRLGFGVVGVIAGFALGAVAGYALVSLLSSNVHDSAVEASMTAVFVAGPIGALIGLVAGIVRGGRKPPA